MKFGFMHAHRQRWPLAVMARVLGVTRQGYHKWSTRQPSARAQRQAAVTERILEVHEKSNGTYGSPRMTVELREEHGIKVTRKTVEHLMRKAGVRVTPKRRYRPTTDSSKTLAPAPNLLDRGFDVDRVNSVWVSDFTELPCREGKAYAVGIMDLASRRIIGLNVHHRMHVGSLMIALHRACKVRRTFPQDAMEKATIFHSDRGAQFNADVFRHALKKHGLQQSMSGVGNCYDNAPIESFWSRMKADLAPHMPFRDPEDARLRVNRYVHLFYNKVRRHSSIGNISPIEFEGRYIKSLRHSS